MVWVIWSGLTALLLGLGWIGWSFFYRHTAMLGPGMTLPAFTGGNWPASFRHWWQVGQRLTKRLAVRPLTVGVPLRLLVVPTTRLSPRWNWRASTWLALGSLLIVISIAITFSMAHRRQPEPVQQRTFQQSEHIRSALSLEKLVPPPPLPPTAFVDRQHPGLEKLDRDWGRMDGEFVQQVLKLRSRMEARGYPLALVEGYRSAERQDQLAGMDTHVTNARGGQSKHQYGFAADLAPVRAGRIVISERDPWAMSAYQAMGEEAEALGLVWGGRWTFRDYGHVELAGSLAKLLKARQSTLAANAR
jgi:peptidoglycan L-alanyl-D-glutamate endopeptidase CwlK